MNKQMKKEREERAYRTARLLIASMFAANRHPDPFGHAEHFIKINRLRPLPENARVEPFTLDAKYKMEPRATVPERPRAKKAKR